MNVVIRADSSLEIGSGHLMRCLTLAASLRERGATVTFVSRHLRGNMLSLVRGNHYTVHELAQRPENFEQQIVDFTFDSWLGVPWTIDAEQTKQVIRNQSKQVNWLIVDHYALDEKWERCFRVLVDRVMVIDDLANRRHDCDVLLDQNSWGLSSSRYQGLVPSHCRMFIGPEHALLRSEFHNIPRRPRCINDGIKRILVFFGGIDISNQTLRAILALEQIVLGDIAIDVVIGQNNPHWKLLQSKCRELNWSCHHQVSNMAELMWRADLAIGASGSTTWERTFLGLPAVMVATAPHEVGILNAFATSGTAVSLGSANSVSIDQIRQAIAALIADPKQVRTMSERCLELMASHNPSAVSEFLISARNA